LRDFELAKTIKTRKRRDTMDADQNVGGATATTTTSTPSAQAPSLTETHEMSGHPGSSLTLADLVTYNTLTGLLTTFTERYASCVTDLEEFTKTSISTEGEASDSDEPMGQTDQERQAAVERRDRNGVLAQQREKELTARRQKVAAAKTMMDNTTQRMTAVTSPRVPQKLSAAAMAAAMAEDSSASGQFPMAGASSIFESQLPAGFRWDPATQKAKAPTTRRRLKTIVEQCATLESKEHHYEMLVDKLDPGELMYGTAMETLAQCRADTARARKAQAQLVKLMESNGKTVTTAATSFGKKFDGIERQGAFVDPRRFVAAMELHLVAHTVDEELWVEVLDKCGAGDEVRAFMDDKLFIELDYDTAKKLLFERFFVHADATKAMTELTQLKQDNGINLQRGLHTYAFAFRQAMREVCRGDAMVAASSSDQANLAALDVSSDLDSRMKKKLYRDMFFAGLAHSMQKAWKTMVDTPYLLNQSVLSNGGGDNPKYTLEWGVLMDRLNLIAGAVAAEHDLAPQYCQCCKKPGHSTKNCPDQATNDRKVEARGTSGHAAQFQKGKRAHQNPGTRPSARSCQIHGPGHSDADCRSQQGGSGSGHQQQMITGGNATPLGYKRQPESQGGPESAKKVSALDLLSEIANDASTTRRVPAGQPCYNCQEPGHMAATCTKARRPPKCFNCQQTGHLSHSCPEAARDRQ
jgi:hypothetical protein